MAQQITKILGKKLGMSQAFVSGKRVPTTKVEASPLMVTQILDLDKNGYWGIQIGFGQKHLNRHKKPLQGHLKGATKEKFAPYFLREIKLSEKPEFKVGDEIKVSDFFGEGDTVSVRATSKGKGFAGGMKRWGFAGGPRTHGQSDRERAPGSIGQGTDPGRVRKGKKMAGRMGGEIVYVRNLNILESADGTLTLNGPIPGPKGNLVEIELVKKGKVKKEDES